MRLVALVVATAIQWPACSVADDGQFAAAKQRLAAGRLAVSALSLATSKAAAEQPSKQTEATALESGKPADRAAAAKAGAQVAPSTTPAVSEKVEVEVHNTFQKVEAGCISTLQSLKATLDKDQRRSAHTNAWGALLAVVGSVTVYAPLKTVLVGVGISSSGGSNSVLGGLAGSFQEDAKATTEQISNFKDDYHDAFLAYRNIQPSSDTLGFSRAIALEHLQAVCDGMMDATSSSDPKTGTAPKPDDKASAPTPAASASG